MNSSPQARQHEHPPAVAASLAGDLRLARRFQAALARGRVRLDWQAVRHAGHPEWEPLYRETLLRVTAASGEPPLPTQELILALERLGLIRLLDRCVLGTVLDRLNAEPTLRLACNLSRQSAAMDAWWEAVCRWLAARPQVARRLTLELTETAVGERVATREFIRRLREHGVRIAIDDFGAAHNNLDFVLDARPDVIKIDCRYTREARRSAKGAEVLRHLLALCRELAPCVVLEGLEEDDAFARLPTGTSISRATRSRRRCGSNRRCPYAGRRAGRGSRRWRAARGDRGGAPGLARSAKNLNGRPAAPSQQRRCRGALCRSPGIFSLSRQRSRP